MLRIPSSSLAAALIVAGISAGPAYAADPHWFYDRSNLNGNGYNGNGNNGHGNNGYGRYEDNQYANGRYDDRRHVPRSDYSAYRPGYEDNGGNGYHHRDHDSRFSCLQGVQNLKQSGFRYIEVVDCSNGSYVYDAVRKREPWRIQVSRTSGEILAVDPLGK